MPGKGDRGGVKEKPKNTAGALKRIIRYLMRYKYLVLAFVAVYFLRVNVIYVILACGALGAALTLAKKR